MQGARIQNKNLRINAIAIRARSMNVVIFGRGFGKSRQLNLSGLSASALALSVVGILSSAAFAIGYYYSAHTGSGISTSEVTILADELQVQRDSIDTIRQANEDTLDALAIRIAQMNARIIRLDALGRRLTGMADLDDGEFDFDSDPALGGPEEPVATGSNVAIPEGLKQCSRSTISWVIVRRSSAYLKAF